MTPNRAVRNLAAGFSSYEEFLHEVKAGTYELDDFRLLPPGRDRASVRYLSHRLKLSGVEKP